MLAHVVLCTLKRDLAGDQREHFARAIAAALRGIPAIRRASVGRRLESRGAYGGASETPYDYAAVLEFDDEAGLRAYLEHPAHGDLASLFWACCERTMVADYRLLDPGSLVSAPSD